ncbi:hypothetical protein GGX14DRAFT_390838 [Mycena pura]|uniref:Uncharacterized protein n=1 Tax=Mycena pura TaxID=153505 RepID=A0AAD6YFF3_9AGAR|nr:hypothetical protein GGX14DRAFT_390838 [Mycena pura]
MIKTPSLWTTPMPSRKRDRKRPHASPDPDDSPDPIPTKTSRKRNLSEEEKLERRRASRAKWLAKNRDVQRSMSRKAMANLRDRLKTAGGTEWSDFRAAGAEHSRQYRTRKSRSAGASGSRKRHKADATDEEVDDTDNEDIHDEDAPEDDRQWSSRLRSRKQKAASINEEDNADDEEVHNGDTHDKDAHEDQWSSRLRNRKQKAASVNEEDEEDDADDEEVHDGDTHKDMWSSRLRNRKQKAASINEEDDADDEEVRDGDTHDEDAHEDDHRWLFRLRRRKQPDESGPRKRQKESASTDEEKDGESGSRKRQKKSGSAVEEGDVHDNAQGWSSHLRSRAPPSAAPLITAAPATGTRRHPRSEKRAPKAVDDNHPDEHPATGKYDKHPVTEEDLAVHHVEAHIDAYNEPAGLLAIHNAQSDEEDSDENVPQEREPLFLPATSDEEEGFPTWETLSIPSSSGDGSSIERPDHTAVTPEAEGLGDSPHPPPPFRIAPRSWTYVTVPAFPGDSPHSPPPFRRAPRPWTHVAVPAPPARLHSTPHQYITNLDSAAVSLDAPPSFGLEILWEAMVLDSQWLQDDGEVDYSRLSKLESMVANTDELDDEQVERLAQRQVEFGEDENVEDTDELDNEQAERLEQNQVELETDEREDSELELELDTEEEEKDGLARQEEDIGEWMHQLEGIDGSDDDDVVDSDEEDLGYVGRIHHKFSHMLYDRGDRCLPFSP